MRDHATPASPRAALLTASLAILGLAGCTPALPRSSRLLRERPPARARTVSYHGWRGCIELSNGLVRVTNVPQVGGRTLEFSLGSYNFLLVGRRELGTTPQDWRDARYPYFGGHFTQLHPETRWQMLQSRAPAALFTGRYTAKLGQQGRAGAASVEMTAPADLATGTRLVRRVELFAGSTHLRITDTLHNLRLTAQEWGIHDFLQLKGHPRPSGILRRSETVRGGLSLYVPLNPKSRFRGGFRRLLPGPRSSSPGARQWNSQALPGLLTLRYAREFSKVAVDPSLPWIAWVDHRSGYAFVQVCRVPEKAIVTAGGPIADYPFIEIQSFAPVTRLAPGRSAKLVQDWYAARCPGPILDVTEAGAISSPLSILRDSAGKTWVAGTFGLFYVGTAALVFRDSQGTELRKQDCGIVGPFEPLVLNLPTEIPTGTAEVILEIRGADGKQVGHLGRILLGSR